MNMTLSSKECMHITFRFLAFFSFVQALFISGCIYVTSDMLLSTRQAYDFIEKVNHIPIAYYKVPVYVILSFLLLCVIMKLHSILKETVISILSILAIEFAICIFLMWSISFTANTILLFVIANMMVLTRQRGNKGLSLLIMILLYLATNYDIISHIIPISDYRYYLSVYSTNARSLLSSINSILTTSCMITFLLFMLFLIQDQYNESKEIRSLNNELQNLNDQLKEYADDREKMGETKERNRLAREIHDTLGHTLTGLSTGLEACKALIDKNSDAAKKQLDILSKVAKDGLKDVRRSVKKLRPDTLENHSLKEALESTIEDFVRTTGVIVHFICHLETFKFQADEEEAIYRIIQEGTTNAVRHGKASEIFISFGMDHDILIIIVEDNGIGCDNIQEGFGLHHMKERVALLNGNVRCYGTNGFVLIVELPLREEERHD
ncbi:MAG: sensor histidine kinase [Erysipelotrichaceae bacterium]|nr:sensor histidine kinase [Erysipelotrichaceae bacterium]